MQDHYKNDFERFLAHTDEKGVLLGKIKEYLAKFSVKSLLDVGAGNGMIAIPLAKEVQRYVAVEPKASLAKKLREAGLEVMEESFPAEIAERFDMVLSSHSVSYKREKYEPFIAGAMSLLNPGGVFLLITYRGQDDDWTHLMESIGESTSDYSRTRFNRIIEFLYSFGDVKEKKVATHVATDNLADMMEALAFVASDGDPARKEEFLKHSPKLEKILSSQYRSNGGYSFPFRHFFLATKRTRGNN